MENSKNIPFINGREVSGEGHLQPRGNPWIGVFIVPEDLYDGEAEGWMSKIIEYEGPFDCKSECIAGRGTAKIIHISRDYEKGNILINTEGIDTPKLEKEMKKKIRSGYSSNLPVEDTKLEKVSR